MKQVILFFSLFLLIGCFDVVDDTRKFNLKYKIGDIVYLKPDSTQAFVSDTSKYYNFYRIGYIDKLGKIEYTNIDEFNIYGKK